VMLNKAIAGTGLCVGEIGDSEGIGRFGPTGMKTARGSVKGGHDNLSGGTVKMARSASEFHK
jgi:hypothetical protein